MVISGAPWHEELCFCQWAGLPVETVSFWMVAGTHRRPGFEHGKRIHIGLLPAASARPSLKGTACGMSAVPGCLFNSCTTGQHNKIGKRHVFVTGLRVEFLWMVSSWEITFESSGGLLVCQFWRRQTYACTIGTSPFIGASEGGGRCPAVENQLRHG